MSGLAYAEGTEVDRPDIRPMVARYAQRPAALVGMALGIRAGLWIVGLAATGYSLRDRSMALVLWARWDGPHYLHVAQHGYVAHGHDALWIVFFPVYPLLVRAVALVAGDLIFSSLVVSFVASLAAAAFLYRITQLDGTRDEAWRAVILFFTFPTAYFLAAPYSEAIFLALVLASIYAARTKNWGWAIAVGAIATASRLTGLALVPALAAEALQFTGRERIRKLASVAFVPLGFVVYLGINQAIFASPLHFMKVERGRPWWQHTVPPWQPLVESVQALAHSHHTWSFWFVYPTRLASAAFAIGVLVWGWRRLRLGDHAFSGMVLLMSLSGGRLISMPRYVLGIYPIFIVLANRIKQRWVLVAFVVVGLALQVYLFSRYARALWAF